MILKILIRKDNMSSLTVGARALGSNSTPSVWSGSPHLSVETSPTSQPGLSALAIATGHVASHPQQLLSPSTPSSPTSEHHQFKAKALKNTCAEALKYTIWQKGEDAKTLIVNLFRGIKYADYEPLLKEMRMHHKQDNLRIIKLMTDPQINRSSLSGWRQALVYRILKALPAANHITVDTVNDACVVAGKKLNINEIARNEDKVAARENYAEQVIVAIKGVTHSLRIDQLKKLRNAL